MDFKIRIRELRKAAGFKSQQAFADAFGVAQSTVGGWEAGKREPGYETTIRLAQFFNCSTDYLLGVSPFPHAALPGLNDSQMSKGLAEAFKHSELSVSELLSLCAKLNPAGQRYVIKQAEFASTQKEYQKDPPAASDKSVV